MARRFVKGAEPRLHGGRILPVTGNCFEESAEYVLHALVLDLVLVHGEVVGHGKLEGIRYAHAWVEDGNNVIDVAKDVRMPRDVYYRLGGIELCNNMHRYSADDILRHTVETGHWGPWELETSTGL